MQHDQSTEWLTDTLHCRAEFPADKVHTLSSNEHIEVEKDGEVKTQ